MPRRRDTAPPAFPLALHLGLGVACGVVLAAPSAPLGFALSALAPAALVGLLLRRPRHLAALWLVLGVGLGSLRQTLEAPELAGPLDLRSALDEGESVDWDARGVIVAGARRTRSGHQAVLELAAGAPRGEPPRPQRGRVRLWWRDGPHDLPAGTCVRVRGRLSRAGPPSHPFAVDRRRADAQQGVVATVFVSELAPSAPCEPDLGARLAGRLDRTRHRLERAVEDSASPRAAAWILAVGAGTRGSMSAADRDEMSRLGLAHLLAVSGLHLSLFTLALATALERLLRLFPRLYLVRERRAWRAAIAIPLAWLFAAFTGASPAALRAALFVSAHGSAALLRRPPSPAAALGVALSVILLDRPALIWGASLQLSLCAVVPLVAFARVVAARRALVDCRPPSRPRAYLRAATWSSLGAFLGSAPILAHHFGAVSLTGLPANVLLAPLLAVILVPAALLALALAPHAPSVVVALGCLVEAVVDTTYAVLDPLADLLRDPWIVGRPTFFEIALWFAACVGVLAGLRRAAMRPKGWGAASLCVATLLVLGEARRAPSGELDAWFLPVGQGDATLLRLPTGHTLLVDVGGSPGASDPGREVVVPIIRGLGIRAIDVVLVTHADIDHIGGLPAVLAAIPVRELWLGQATASHYLVGEARATARGDPVIRWVDGTQPPRRLGQTVLETLHPPAEPVGLDENDASLALRVSFAGHAMLFTGDSEGPGEAQLVARSRERLRADVLQSPHHGSDTSSGTALLGAVLPRYVVVSAGESNRFGFPHRSVMRRYADFGATVLRTDTQGLIRMRLGHKGIAVQTFRDFP